MIPPFKSFPLSARLTLTGAMFLFNYLLLFPSVGALAILPFYNMDIEKVYSVLSGHFITSGDKYALLFVQFIGSVGAFVLTSLLMAQLESVFVAKRLGVILRPSFKMIAIAVISIFASQLLIQFLGELNQKIPLPEVLKKLEELGKQSEETEAALLKGSSILMFLANTVVLAVVPAIGEELFFRGIILGDLLKSRVNPVVAIVSTGLLFSLAHMQFNNILAIWVLGSFLGYLYYISGSLWLSVIAHFTNNFLLILLKYIYNAGFIKTDIAEADMPLYATLVSIALFLVCVLVLHKWRRPVDFELELADPDLTNEENYSE